MIVHQIVLRLESHLRQKLSTEIATGDASRVAEVKAYRWQKDPEKSFVWVSGNDPTDIMQKDGRISAKDMDNLGLNIPMGEYGGGHWWWRRGVVSVNCFFNQTQYNEVLAADTAYRILGRTLDSIATCPVIDLVDEFGERAQQIMAYATNFIEGGGPPRQYIWRGTISWQVLTHHPR